MELLEIVAAEGAGVVYDIGAFVGTWSLLARAILPTAEIHAFEPLPRHCMRFRQATAHFPGIALHQVALAASAGCVNMHVAQASDSSSLLPLTDLMAEHFGISEQDQVPVQAKRLDDYASAEAVPVPDLIKLDVQGGELDVLRGGVQCLAHAKWVICEVSFVRFYAGQPLFQDVVGFLHDHCFELHALGADTPLSSKLIQADVLFRRTN